jgi:hypothetical protein
MLITTTCLRLARDSTSVTLGLIFHHSLWGLQLLSVIIRALPFLNRQAKGFLIAWVTSTA